MVGFNELQVAERREGMSTTRRWHRLHLPPIPAQTKSPYYLQMVSRRPPFSPSRLIRATCVGAALSAVSACSSRKPTFVDGPVAVSIGHNVRTQTQVRPNARLRDFWGAMSNLDPTYTDRNAVTESESAFARGLKLAMAGEIEPAELVFDALRNKATDEIVRSASMVLFTAMLQSQGKWKVLAGLGDSSRADVLAVVDKAGVRAWATAFRDAAPISLSFPNSAILLPLNLSEAGTPVIPVRIGDHTRLFWLDTGSSMSIISKDVASAAGVVALTADTLEVVTSTGRIAARPAIIREMSLGGLKVQNAPAMIVENELLRIRLADSHSAAPEDAMIEGIIGFDLISRIDTRLDYSHARATLRNPASVDPVSFAERNLFWLGTPVVRLLTGSGIPTHFYLDTGAQETYSTIGLIEKSRVRSFLGERRVVGGFAGAKRVPGRFIGRLQLWLAGQSLVFEKLLVLTPSHFSFVTLDGILGSDIGKAGVIHIDATNGLFSIETPARDDAIILRVK